MGVVLNTVVLEVAGKSAWLSVISLKVMTPAGTVAPVMMGEPTVRFPVNVVALTGFPIVYSNCPGSPRQECFSSLGIDERLIRGQRIQQIIQYLHTGRGLTLISQGLTYGTRR